MERRQSIILYILMFNMFITMGGLGIIVPVMPAYLEKFQADGQIYGFLIATFSFAQFILSPIIGNYSDRLGRKKFIVIGLVIYGSGQILFGLAHEIWILFVARFLNGVGAAFVMPTILAYVGDITTVKQRGKGMSLIGASISFGFTIGPAIGGLLSSVNLTFPFFCAGVISILSALLSLTLLPDIKTATFVQTRRESLVKQMLSSTKLTYFIYLIVVFTFSFGIANYQATLSLYLDDKFQYTPLVMSLIFTVGGLAGVILQLFFIEKLFTYFGEIKMIMVNLFIASITLLLLIFVSGYFLIVLVASLNTIAATLIRPAVNTVISRMAGSEQGFAAGLNNAYMSLGNLFGPICAGTLYDWHMDSPYIFGTCVLMACCILVFTWSVKNNKRTYLESSKIS
jgi:MFS transporter, DHA1 family, multidrug resistance protein